MQQFLEVFSELKGKKLYLTGESVSIRHWAIGIRLMDKLYSMLEHTFLVGLASIVMMTVI